MSKRIKAGQTDAFCGETIRITDIPGIDPEGRELVGATGRITHPYPGLMLQDASHYIAGVELDAQYADLGSRMPMGNSIVNLVNGDAFEVIDHSTADLYPDYL